MIDTVVSGNQVLYGSATEDADGALFFFGSTPPTFALDGVTFDANFADEDGSAIRVSTGTGTITGCVFTEQRLGGQRRRHLRDRSGSDLDRRLRLHGQHARRTAARIRFFGDPSWKAGGAVTVDRLHVHRTTWRSTTAVPIYVRVRGHARLARATRSTTTRPERTAVRCSRRRSTTSRSRRIALDRNAGGAGGAFSGEEIATFVASSNRFCMNLASNTTTSDGGAASLFDVGSGGTHRWSNNTFVHNYADSNGGDLGAPRRRRRRGREQHVRERRGEGRRRVGLAALGRPSRAISSFVNNIVAWAYEGDGFRTDDNSTQVIEYNDFWMNVENAVGGSIRTSDLSPTNLAVDPQFGNYTDDEDCDDDEFWLEATSPLADAG